MPDVGKTLVKLAAKFVEHQAKKQLGEGFLVTLSGTVTEYGGESVSEKLTNFLDQGEKAEKVLEAFQLADNCFAQKSEEIGEERLKQAVRSTPLAALPSLEKLAAALPETLDDAGRLAALRSRFEDDWSKQLSDEQLDRAATVCRDCLSLALAVKCDQLGVWTFLEVRATRADAREIKSILINAANLGQLGLAREWLPPTPRRPSRPLVGRVAELDEVRKFLTHGAKAAITAAVHGPPGVGKTLLAEHLAAELDSKFTGGVLFERFGSGLRDPALAAPILNRWAEHAFGGRSFTEGVQLAPDAVRALLTWHGPLLVVLDDVWELKAIQPLLDALPSDACVLITTRSAQLARKLRGKVRMLEAPAGYDEALRYYRPEVAISEYTDTQNNRAVVLCDISTLPGENRRARLLEALRCAHTALSVFEQIGHVLHSQVAADTLRQVREEAGELFPELWAELNVGEPPEWLRGE